MSEKMSNQELLDEMYIVKKKEICPVCDSEFEYSTVRSVKIKLVDSDIDLRTYYEPVDPLYYDIVVCEHCGYAADTIFFEDIKRTEKDRLKRELENTYESREYPDVYSPNDTIHRLKLAFNTADIKGGKISEKAYLFLKTAWIFRDMKNENLEKKFLESALIGFEKAYIEEDFPICTMDMNTLKYLIGALNYLNGNYNQVNKWIFDIIADQDENPRLRIRAEDLRELIRDKITEDKEEK